MNPPTYIKFEESRIKICLKFDELVKTLSVDIVKDVKKYINKIEKIPAKILLKYNIYVAYNAVVKNAHKNSDKLNDFTKAFISSVKNGTTLKFYMMHHTDNNLMEIFFDMLYKMTNTM